MVATAAARDPELRDSNYVMAAPAANPFANMVKFDIPDIYQFAEIGLQQIKMTTLHYCDFVSKVLPHPNYVVKKDIGYVDTIPEQVKIANAMFWKGIQIDDWNKMNVFDKTMTSNLALVLGLYDETVYFKNSTNKFEITFCGILDQIPQGVAVKRVCFLPYKLGNATIYKTLKHVSTQIWEGFYANGNLITNIKQLQKVTNDEKKTLGLTKTQYTNFIDNINLSTLDTPYKLLAFYCTCRYKDNDPAANKVLYKIPSNKAVLNLIWILLTKLGYVIRSTTNTKTDETSFKVFPSFTKQSLRAKVIAALRKDGNNVEAADTLINNCEPLILFIYNFLSYPSATKACADIAGAGKGSKEDTSGGDTLSVENDPIPFYHNINIQELLLTESGEELKNCRPFKNCIDNFKKAVYEAPMKDDILEFADSIKSSYPEHLRWNLAVSGSVDGSIINADNIVDIVEKSVQHDFNNIFRSESEDVAAGYGIKDIFEQLESETTELESNYIVDELAKQLVSSRQIQRMTTRPGHFLKRIPEYALRHRSMLKTGEDVGYIMNSMVSNMKALEKTHGVEINADVKEVIAKQGNAIIKNLYSLYKTCVVVDFTRGLLEFIGRGGSANKHGLDETDIDSETLNVIYNHIKPSLTSNLNAYQTTINKIIEKVSGELGVQSEELEAANEELF
nr:4a protein [Carp edema virus]